MSTQEELKKKYNQWVQCFWRGTKDLEEIHNQIEELERQSAEKTKVIQQQVLLTIDKYRKELEATGYILTNDEAVYGFGEVMR